MVAAHLCCHHHPTRSGKVRMCEAGPPDPLHPSIRNSLRKTPPPFAARYYPYQSILVCWLSYNVVLFYLRSIAKTASLCKRVNTNKQFCFNRIASIIASIWTMVIWKSIDQNRLVGVGVTNAKFIVPFQTYVWCRFKINTKIHKSMFILPRKCTGHRKFWESFSFMA